MMKMAQLIKAANRDPKVRKYLLKWAGIDDTSKFNENVQSLENENTGQYSGQGMQNMFPKQAVPVNGFPPPGVQMDDQGAAGDQAAAEQEANDPTMVAVRTAQAFLGPEIMDQALNGNQNAMELLSRTATQMASNAVQGGLTPQEPQDMGGGQGMDEGQYAAVPNTVGMTPEDELAERIIGVQDVNAYPNAFPAANSTNTGDSVDLNDQGTGVPKEASVKITAEDIRNVMRVFA
jgi:hypothetical protein